MAGWAQEERLYLKRIQWNLSGESSPSHASGFLTASKDEKKEG